MKLSIILSFLGTLLPVVFPDKEFNPKRLGAVVVLLITLSTIVHFMGVDNASAVIDLTDDVMELTTE